MTKILHPRKVWHPKDPLAPLAFYTTPVKQVVKRWRTKIGAEIFDANIHSLMIHCNWMVQAHDPTSRFFHYERFAIEVAIAIENIRVAWSEKLDDKMLGFMLENYTTPLLASIAELDPQLATIFKAHRLFILELLLAVDEALNDPDNLSFWILKYYDSGDASDYVNDIPTLRPWTKISKMIQAATISKTQPKGRKIQPDAIRTEASRMKLTV